MPKTHFSQKNIDILGVRVDYLTKKQALEKIENFIFQSKKGYAVTVNPEFVLTATKDRKFRDVLNASNFSLADGVGLVFASRWLTFRGYVMRSLPETVPGIDLVHNLAMMAARRGWTIFLLGGMDGVAAKTAYNLKTRYPGLQIAGTFEGISKEVGDSETAAAILEARKKINADIDILFVAYGHPNQEKWIARQLPRLPVRFAMGVGGAFDVLSGSKPTVPHLFKQLHLDWLWRFVIEPRRLPRIFRAVAVFPLRVILNDS